jgi:hypothetical protein
VLPLLKYIYVFCAAVLENPIFDTKSFN